MSKFIKTLVKVTVGITWQVKMAAAVNTASNTYMVAAAMDYGIGNVGITAKNA